MGFPALPVTPVMVSPTPRPAAPTTPPTVFERPPTVLPSVEVTKVAPFVRPESLLPIVMVQFERRISGSGVSIFRGNLGSWVGF